jgi:hypothetical protein
MPANLTFATNYEGATKTSIGGKIYLIDSNKKLWQYDPATDTYTMLSNPALNSVFMGAILPVGQYIYDFADSNATPVLSAPTYRILLNYTIYKTYVFIDTSSVGANTQIQNATLEFYGAINNATVPFWVIAENGQPSYPHSPLQAGDYAQGDYSGSAGATPNTVTFTTTGYNYIIFNSTGIGWINKTGITKLCLISSATLSDTAPTGNGYVTIYTYEEGSSYSPKLILKYFTVSISPASATMDVGQSKTFTSSVSWGTPPYTYQWCLNGSSVGTNSSSWTFTPSSAGYYTVYINVTDSTNKEVKSNVAAVTVYNVSSVSISPTSVTVGGIYIPVNKLELLAPYIGLTILLAVALITVGYVKKRKRDREINS